MVEFRPDVVISANMPLDAQNLLQQATRNQGARFVFWLQDVYSVAVRFVLSRKAKPLAAAGGWYFERLEKKLLRQSDAVVCIAPGFAEFVRGWGVPESKIAVIRNWAPLDEVVPAPRDNAWARENGVDARFCFMYSGTLGMKHRPELLLDLARRLDARKDARLVVIAGGAGADWLRERAHEVSPDTLTVLPFQPYSRISEVMGSADVLITLLDSEAKTFAVPSKTLSYLCAGRALIVAAPAANEAARVVEEAQAGLVVSPDEPAGIVSAAERFLQDRVLLAECASNARRYAEQHFSIDAIVDRFLDVLQPGAGNREVDAENLVLANGGERKPSWQRPA
jgi:glycosyltransferase involved in cell wall biosynthesis